MKAAEAEKRAREDILKNAKPTTNPLAPKTTARDILNGTPAAPPAGGAPQASPANAPTGERPPASKSAAPPASDTAKPK